MLSANACVNWSINLSSGVPASSWLSAELVDAAAILRRGTTFPPASRLTLQEFLNRMSRSRLFLAFFTVMLAGPLAVSGQGAAAAPNQQPPPSWVPQGFEALGQRATLHNDFTFDRSMLQLAGKFMGNTDAATRNAIAKLNSISVHSYHFATPGLYDPGALDLIRRQYEAAGWRHLVAAHGKGDPFDAGQTDVWINLAHVDVTGMMVLISTPKDLDLIALNGDISTVDLLHLRGHFGIPRFSGDSFVAGPSEEARHPYVAPAPGAVPDQAPAGVGVGVGVGSSEVQPAPPPPTPPE